jgi:hypothetical protein
MNLQPPIQYILAARNNDSALACFAVMSALAAAAYIWHVYSDRKALKSECGSAREQLLQANRELHELRSKEASMQAEAEARLEHRRAELDRQAKDLAHAQDRRFAARESEIAAAEDALSRKLVEARAIYADWKNEIEAMQMRLEGAHRAFDGGFLQGRKWLASAYSELLQYYDDRHEWSLALTAQPGTKVATELAEVKRQRRDLLMSKKLLEWQLASYEEYFPELADYRDAILDESLDLRQRASEALEGADPALAKGYLSKQEFDLLDRVEKFQLALERYKERGRSAWEVGRDYERQIGHQYEVSGWRVAYHGALQGVEDLGRDLICQKGKEVEVVQCKCWIEERPIRERHVFQLYGTSVLHRIQLANQGIDVRPVFVTTGVLSDVAAKAASALGIRVQRVPRQDYPLIKCNISTTTREKIYHLPFDQQYDRVAIGNQAGEGYVATVSQAEQLGFRRAFKWSGQE